MSTNLILAPETEQDLEEAYAWYEHQRTGLDADFLSCVDACIQSLRRWPEMHAVVFNTYRRALVRRFPFAVFYEFNGVELVVYGVLHTARDPQKWRERLK